MAETQKISMSELEEYLTDLVEKEVKFAQDTLDEVLSKRAMQLRGRLRDLSPKDTEGYANGWRVKTAQRNGEKVKIIYNAKKPWLTYLLEYGTRKMKARQHIRRAADETIDEIIDELVGRL